jgi:CHAD domain-containing protein
MAKAWCVDGIEPEGTLADNARRVVRVRIGELYSYAPAVADESAVTAQHDMRIAAKRLRYSLELFRAVLGDEGEAAISVVRELQELLGTIHDIDVRISHIQEQICRCSIEDTVEDHLTGLTALLRRQRTARHAAYVAFRDRWNELANDLFRERLVALSVAPLPEQPASVGIPASAAGALED